MTSCENTLDLFKMVDALDVLTVLGLEHEHCGIEGCTTPAAGLAVGDSALGTIGVTPICAEHVSAPVAVAKAVQFDEYEVVALMFEAERAAIRRFIAADAFPFVVRMPTRFEQTMLCFRNADGVPGFVQIILPYEQGDMLVQHAPGLKFVCDELLAGKSLTMMGADSEHRLLMIEASMADFEAFE